MVDGVLNTLLFGISFLVVLSALVFFHELGHYSVARLFKVAVERFSIGFGKPIARWTAKSGTEWTISRIPLGGFVRFAGDKGAASNPDTEQLEQIKQDLETSGGDVAVSDCFHFKPLWQRVLIVLAGPVANFVLAVLIFAGLAWKYGAPEMKPVVIDVIEGSAAEAAGVLPKDVILSFNGKSMRTSSDVVAYVSLRSNETLELKVDRGGEIVTLPITPRREDSKDFIGGTNAFGKIGARIGGEDVYKHREFGPISALGYGAGQVKDTIATTGTYIGRIFQGRESGEALGGVVRIAAITGKTAVDAAADDYESFGQKLESIVVRLLGIGAALSIGLGVANLMPIPVLDGGHLLYYGYEAVAGRPLSERKQEFGFRIGFVVLLTLFLILTWNDIGYVRSFFS